MPNLVLGCPPGALGLVSNISLPSLNTLPVLLPTFIIEPPVWVSWPEPPPLPGSFLLSLTSTTDSSLDPLRVITVLSFISSLPIIASLVERITDCVVFNNPLATYSVSAAVVNPAPVKEFLGLLVNLKFLLPVLNLTFVSLLGSGIANTPEQLPLVSVVKAEPALLPVGVTKEETSTSSKKG